MNTFFALLRRTGFTLAVFLAAVSALPAQEVLQQPTSSFFLGVHGAWSIAGHSFKDLSASYSGDKTGTFTGGISVVYKPDVTWLSVQARLSYNDISASPSRPGESVPSRVRKPDGGDTIITSTTESVYDIQSTFYTTDLLATVSPFEYFALGFTGGLSVNIPVKADYKAKYNLITPTDVHFIRDPNSPYRYENRDRTIVMHEASLSGVQLTVTGGLQYEFPIGGYDYDIAIVPSVLYSFPITKLSDSDLQASGTGWDFSQLRTGIDILFRL